MSSGSRLSSRQTKAYPQFKKKSSSNISVSKIFPSQGKRSKVTCQGRISSDIYTAVSQLTRPFYPYRLNSSLMITLDRRSFQRKKLRHGQVKCPAQDQAANVKVSKAAGDRAILLHHNPAGGGGVRVRDVLKQTKTNKQTYQCLPPDSRKQKSCRSFLHLALRHLKAYLLFFPSCTVGGNGN